jgi:hypothetical protein
MVRKQIYVTQRQDRQLKRLASRTRKSAAAIIREAIDNHLRNGSESERAQIIKETAGLWKDRTDLPDFAALRREFDRIPLPPQD